jgi:hypothetical protein
MAKTDLVKADLPAIASPGSRPLKNSKHERYCRLRATMLPRAQAYREAGWNTRDDDGAYSHACGLERRPGVRERIEYLSRQDEQLIREKRRRIEETLWNIHEGDIGDFFETVEVAKTSIDGKLATDPDGRMVTVRRQRPKLISDLPPEARKLIEDVTVDRNGNVIPKLYSKSEANRELRKFHNIGRTDDRPEADVSRLSDAELIAQLADQAKQLGVEINLNYDFAKPVPAIEAVAANDGQVIDNDSPSGASAPAADSAADVSSSPPELTNELSVGSTAPASARRLNKAGRGKR